MDQSWAADNLQTIRTLMERAAIYRRALAPVMLLLGVLGSGAGLAGWALRLNSSQQFGLFWMAVSLAGLSGAYLLVRRQALKADEPFWSPPTRRVTQAMLPPLFAGFVAGLVMIFPEPKDSLYTWWLLPVWMMLYGCAVHAAGFFTPRGMKLLGWLFILSGSALAWKLTTAGGVHPLMYGHLAMGAAFGGLHLAYGVYLYLTERRKNEA